MPPAYRVYPFASLTESVYSIQFTERGPIVRVYCNAKDVPMHARWSEMVLLEDTRLVNVIRWD